MKNLLIVNSSVRGIEAQSYKLSELFLAQWRENNPNGKFLVRDLVKEIPPHPTHAFTKANYTPMNERTDEMNETLRASDSLIDELMDANQIVFSVPMYNFSVPSLFKAYIDNLVRLGRTFSIGNEGGFEGLVKDKKALVITTRGAMYGENSPIASFDHQEPYLRTVFGFMGLNDLEFVHADGLDFAEKEYRAQSLENAKAQLSKIANA